MINGPECFLVFLKIKFCLLLIFDFISIEFISPSYVIKMLNEITVVLSPTIYASTILIAETGEGAPWVHMPLSFQSLQGPALDPLVALSMCYTCSC